MIRLARDLTRDDVLAIANDKGAKPFQARALVEAIFDKGLRSLERATFLPKDVRAALESELALAASRIVDRSVSSDGTVKFLHELSDGETIESVLIPDGDRTTLCVSSQVGCPVACVFCASGLAGVRRNLTSAEIVDQFLFAREHLEAEGQRDTDQRGRRLTNVVVMGLGEPMLNLDNVEAALRMISRDLEFSPRRITISTSGYPDRVVALAARALPWNLAISLHAADSRLRKDLVPTATKEPRELVAAARAWFESTGREPTFEIVLLRGQNDRLADADALIALLRGQACTVNLLPWNPVAGVEPWIATPTDEVVQRFAERLESGGIKTTWRRRRGADRDAACGQLRLRHVHSRSESY
ncbi:MAG: 23S rRNA (adenine(2503)-C(2))-methyltransferase RlmN [Planctomycetes bacterium]|nr:23S rRNA (adenine(2503)-C(2))-methyltransferase RlmN [Planctomycetota bacterium]MCB9918320.1 23S rRNA (adenine(2503)-C(2))-methyltransferase RlmN [Planctomycetota bacterium]